MLVFIKGAGDLASGIAVRLYNAGFHIIMSDLEVPTSVRRSVCFSEAMRLGETDVEGIRAKRLCDAESTRRFIGSGGIPVIDRRRADIAFSMNPDALVDAIMAKENTGTTMGDAPIVIGVGPGFTAGTDCDAVVETKRGHTLGRAIYKGSAIPNTGVPGLIGGYTVERLIRADRDGIFHPEKTFGDLVEKKDTVANIDGHPICANIPGMVRGILQDGIAVHNGMKCGDIDPRGKDADYTTVSDKALSIGGGVLEAILHFKTYGRKKGER